MKTYAIIGLGYVGLGLAVALAEKAQVIGYDINSKRIADLKNQHDTNYLISKKELSQVQIYFTDVLEEIKQANFYIVCVSTPAYYYETPDLEPLISSIKTVATVIKKGDIIVFESTVYPGTTEEICIPLLEEISQLKCGKDFNVGYSPERINPGDKKHTLKTITKILGAQNKTTLAQLKKTYSLICDHVYPVSNIATAEAVKILENTQRDVNIAFMNEFAKIMHSMDLDVQEIIAGAETKWSFVKFKPGFVGGHCISIDPHYLAFKAKRLDLAPDLILTARKVNDNMTHFVIESMFKLLTHHHINTNNIKIGLFGISYKENTNDTRNSLALKLIKDLKTYDVEYCVHDPFDHDHHTHTLSVSLTPFEAMQDLTVAILAVGHDYYKNIGIEKIIQKCKKPPIIMDIPGLFMKKAKSINQLIYWKL